MARCKSCGAEINWVTTFSGKKMPVDAQELWFAADGGKDVFVTSGGAVIHGTRVESGRADGRIGHISHFATCPNANLHRRRIK